MSFTPDHSGNFPSEFEYCPDCGLKGVYRILGRPIVRRGEVVDQTYDQYRCKYCKRTSPLPPNHVGRG